MDLYGVAKALHVISVITWMAGLLYLPRLFVYHAEAGPGTSESTVFKTMERRLLRAIMNPAMVATWVFGITLLYLTPAWLADAWLHAKLAAVVGLTAFHHFLARCWKRFNRDENQYSPKFFRIINELPTVLMIAIVFLVVLKPF